MRKLFLYAATLLLACCTGVQQDLKLWYNTPATYFEESLLIGNGRQGAIVYGGADCDSIFLNDLTLWTGKPVDNQKNADANQHLPAVRDALFSEDYRKSDELLHLMQGSNSAMYQPLATMVIKDVASGELANYYRELNISNATASVSYERGGVHYGREYLASFPDHVIGIHLTADKKQAINADLLLTSQLTHALQQAQGNAVYLTGHAMGDEQETVHFGAYMVVVNRDGSVTQADSALQLRGVSEATVWFLSETSFNGFDKHPVKEGKDYDALLTEHLNNIKGRTYQQVRKAHVADYKRLFDRVNLCLDGTVDDTQRTTEQQLLDYTDNREPNPYLETLYFQFGRYLLISSSRTPGIPANLQGLWNKLLSPPWRSNYTININLEENYWPVETTNLGELLQPYEDLLKGLAVTGSYSAKNYYGVQHGWCAGHNTDPWATSNPVSEGRGNPKWANWTMGGAWLVTALWEHYAFTQDKDYLRQTAYPLLKGAAEFCLDWLIENPKCPGELITAPSTSPEAEYVSTDGYKGQSLYGGTADLAIIRELFLATIGASQILGVDDGMCAQMQDALDRLHPYQIGSRGNLQEWYYDWEDEDWHHRHQSHLIGLYPGHHISVDNTPELAQACRRSLEIKGDRTTGWSAGWRTNLWARLGDGEHAYHMLRTQLSYVSPDDYDGPDARHRGGTYPNMLDAHPPFQIDGNFGGTAAVCEMLMQSTLDGGIHLLPALPEEWAAGQVSGLCARGGFTVDLSWRDHRVTSVTLHSILGGTTTVRTGTDVCTVSVKPGKSVTLKY